MIFYFVPLPKLLQELLGRSFIETPFTLLEEPVKVLLLDAVKVALGLVPKILNAFVSWFFCSAKRNEWLMRR